MRKSDGTIFHLSSGTTVDPNSGSGTQVILGGGNITVHP